MTDAEKNVQNSEILFLAFTHRNKLPRADRRGLSDEMLEKFFGYLPKFIHPAAPNSIPTPRFIVRLGDSSDTPSFNAILTPSGRKHFNDPDRWEFQKTLTAGKKLLFNPKALDEEFCAVTEGEIDAVSLIQAFKERRTIDAHFNACALGGAGIFADLLKRLQAKEVAPKLILIFDKDKAGQERAQELFKKLSKLGFAAAIEYLDDFMTDEDRKALGDKIDANKILTSKGCLYLSELLKDILAKARVDIKQTEVEIAARKDFEQVNQTGTTPDLPAMHARLKNSSSVNANAESEGFKDLKEKINATITPATLINAGLLQKASHGHYCCVWCGSGTGDKKSGALSFYPSPPHFTCHICHKGGDIISFLAHVWNVDNNGKSHIELVKRIADTFHVPYDPKIFAPPKKSVTNAATALDIPVDLQDELQAFQEQYGNIDTKILPKLEAAKKFIDGLSPLNFKASFAYEPASRSKVALCRFYLPSIAQKFFDTLKAARKLSAAILKQISRETAALEKAGETVPNVDIDEVTRLAEITPNKITADVDTAVTSLKRKQKRFDKAEHQKAEIDAKRAALDAQIATSAWTQNTLSDCPINLFIPDSVFFSAGGVGIQSINKFGELEKYSATKSPIVPTKIFRTPQSHATKYEVAVKSRRLWRRIIVDGDELADPRKILRLAKDGGALIKNAKILTSFFAEVIAANEDRLPEIACYTRPGWHDGKFIYPTPEDEDSYRVERSGIDYNSIFKAHGDKDKWLLKFLDVTNGKQGALKRFIFGACAIAPLLEIIKIPNPQINLWGTSNFAKTPLPKFGLSIFGDPGEGAMLRTWSATPKNMLTISAGFNCLPILVDEGETMSKWTQTSLSEYVYNFSIGVIGQANKRNGDVRSTEKFHGVRLSTAERPLHDTADKRGAFKRLIDIHVTEPLFEDSYARQLHIFCERNHGHFGRQWTKYIEEHADEIISDFDRTENFFDKAGFQRDGLRVDFKSVDATNARVVIACAVAYQHFYACSFEEPFDFSAAIDDAAVILAQLPTIEEISDVNRSIELLASWVVENPTRFITPRKSQYDTPVDGEDNPATSYAGTVGKNFTDGRIAFFANAFRKIIADIGLPSYEKVLCDLYDADFLDCKSSREKCKMIKVDGKAVRAYVLKSDTLFASDDEADDD